MAETEKTYSSCPLVIVRLEEPEVRGDDLAETLREELVAVYEPTGAIHLVVDFARVTYISSAGLRPLLHLAKRARERSGAVVLCNLSEGVNSVFEATRLVPAGTFQVARDVPSAVASLV